MRSLAMIRCKHIRLRDRKAELPPWSAMRFRYFYLDRIYEKETLGFNYEQIHSQKDIWTCPLATEVLEHEIFCSRINPKGSECLVLGLQSSCYAPCWITTWSCYSHLVSYLQEGQVDYLGNLSLIDPKSQRQHPSQEWRGKSRWTHRGAEEDRRRQYPGDARRVQEHDHGFGVTLRLGGWLIFSNCLLLISGQPKGQKHRFQTVPKGIFNNTLHISLSCFKKITVTPWHLSTNYVYYVRPVGIEVARFRTMVWEVESLCLGMLSEPGVLRRTRRGLPGGLWQPSLWAVWSKWWMHSICWLKIHRNEESSRGACLRKRQRCVPLHVPSPHWSSVCFNLALKNISGMFRQHCHWDTLKWVYLVVAS